MERYNYLEQVTEDVIEAIENRYTAGEIAEKLRDLDARDEFEMELHDELWTDDNVTGNGSGSYYCNAWKAEEALMHNLDLLAEACEEFGGGIDVLKEGAEACDVTIRCYLLGQAISYALDEFVDDKIPERTIASHSHRPPVGIVRGQKGSEPT